MTTPSPHQFAALARSSPWRWRTLRFQVKWRGRMASPPVRAWVRRPDAVRVEDLAGALLQAHREERPRRGLVAYVSSGPAPPPPPGPLPPLDPRAPRPELDADGLAVRRPSQFEVEYDDPMYRDYHWVAMLDPVELVDGHDDAGDAVPGTDIRDLRRVDHFGREAWEAVLRTTPAYDPRCSCCPLLFGVHSEAREVEAGARPVRDRQPDLRYADAHRVRLDVGTGVCVLTEELGGSCPGTGHELRIESVDEDLPDALFSA